MRYSWNQIKLVESNLFEIERDHEGLCNFGLSVLFFD